MLCRQYLTPPSSPKTIAINIEVKNNNNAEENQYSDYANHYGISDNYISPMHEIQQQQQQQQQCYSELEDIRTPPYTDNTLAINNAFYHQIYNDDWEKTPNLFLHQSIPAINNNNNNNNDNNDFQQEYCTNHRVTSRKGKLSNTFPTIHDNQSQKPKSIITNTTIIDLSSVEHSHSLIKSQSNNYNNNTTTTIVPDSLFHKLHIDILEHIFKCLDRTALIRCASTCKRWCRFFLDWQYFWKVVKNDPIILTDKDSNNNEESLGQQRILKEPSTKIGLLVEKILYRRRMDQFVYYTDNDTDEEDMADEEEYTKEIINLMADTHYTRLKWIHLSKITNINPTILSKALISSSYNLTTVHLHHCNTIPPEIVLGEILDKCESLLELSYIQQKKVQQQRQQNVMVYDDIITAHNINYTRSTYRSLSPRRNRLALRKLFIDLGNSNNYDTINVMEERATMHYFLPGIVQKCPNLQLLVWNPADHADHNTVFHNINQYCSYIQWMITTTTAMINTTEHNYDNNEDYTKSQQEANMGALIFDNFVRNHYIPPTSGKPYQGLVCLDIFDPAINISRETLDSILKRHSATIKTLYLPYHGKSRVFWEALNGMIQNPLINLAHAFFVGTVIPCLDYSLTTTTTTTTTTATTGIITTSSKRPLNHGTTSYTTMGDINSFDFKSTMVKLFSSWKKLESISFNGYYSEMDTSVCMTHGIIEQLLFRCKNLNQVSFAHCFENVHEFAEGLKTLSTYYPTTAIRDLTLDCGLLVSFMNRYNTEEYLISGALQTLQILRVAHVPNTSIANPCFCQCSATLYKLLHIRKILNSRGGDVLYSSPTRAFIII